MENLPLSIEVKSTYLDSLSRPHKRDYIFSYTVSIYIGNESDIQLLGKTLNIRDGRKTEDSITYDEINGEQAWVPAGDTYKYSEFHTMRTTTGNLRGTLIARVIESDEVIKVDIPLTFFRTLQNEEDIYLQRVAR